MAVKIQIRRDSAADWTSNNPVLAEGEIGLELDTKKWKIGDGATAWTTLLYYNGNVTATKIDDLTDGDDNTDLNASTSKHGLMPKFPNTAGGNYLDESGTWSVPPGGSAVGSPIVVAANDATAAEKAFATASGGAICDGTADNVQIQAAIDACSGTRMQKVLLLGTFTIAATIYMESYVSLETHGSVTLVNSAGNITLLRANNKDHFEVIGGKWDGNKANQTDQSASGLFGFYFYSGCNNFLVRDVEICNCHHEASYTTGNGMYLDGVTYAEIRDCYVHNCGEDASPYIAANANGIQVSGNSTYVKVIGCTIDTCNGGIYVFATTGNTLKYCNFSNNLIMNIARDGISLYVTPAGLTGVNEHHVVSDNVIISAGLDGDHPGIVIGNAACSSYNSVTGNVIVGDGSWTAAGIICTGNYNVIANNNIHDCCTTTDSSGSGITIIDQNEDDSGGNFNVITGNVISNNRNFGISVELGDYNLIANNLIYDNGAGSATHGGISIWSTSSYNDILNNIIYDANPDWIYMAGTTVSNRIEGNRFSSTGVVVDTSTTNIYKNNQGYIGHGEIRTISKVITAGVQNTVTSIQNTYGNNLYILEAIVIITTAASATNPTYDMGTDDDGAGAPSVGNNLFEAIPDTVGCYSSLSNGLGGAASGVQTNPVSWPTSGNDYVNFIITDAAGADTAGRFTLKVIGA